MSGLCPFQKIHFVRANVTDQPVLIAANQGSLYCLDIRTGDLLAQWPHSEIHDETEEEIGVDGGRPAKRRKFQSNGTPTITKEDTQASDESIEIATERRKGERRGPNPSGSKLPAISHLLTTQDARYLIAVTAEDKAVRVFTISSGGKLEASCVRCLPKRPCALSLTKGDSQILVADKFGDVYALPLVPDDEYVPPTKMPRQTLDFTPSASELTVHTKGNLDALRQQQNLKNFQPRKEGPAFEHKLILGHVSLLTDLITAEGPVKDRTQQFILTADRDEHIRVSRGIPQAHIVETYCLGHREFITQLCIHPLRKDILVAGNGEPTLRTYSWQTGEAIQCVHLAPFVQQVLAKDDTIDDPAQRELISISSAFAAEHRTLEKLTVSTITAITLTDQQTGSSVPLFLVVLEGFPFVLSFSLNDTDDLLFLGSSPVFASNVLDLAHIVGSSQIVIAFDTLHRSCSMKTLRDASTVAPMKMLDAYTLTLDPPNPIEGGLSSTLGANELRWSTSSPSQVAFPTTVESWQLVLAPYDTPVESSKDGDRQESMYSEPGEFLYGLENLRKKRTRDPEEVGHGQLQEPQEHPNSNLEAQVDIDVEA